MKKFNKNLLIAIVIFSFVLSFSPPMVAQAATTPSLGSAATYGVLSGTYINTVAGTTVNGDVGYTTGPATVPTVNGTIYGAGAPTPTARTDAATALTNLDAQACTFTFAAGAINLATDATHGTAGVYTPGVYCTQGAGAASIGTGGITLSGAGTYVFRVNGALTSVDNSVVTLANGASSCDVFWTPIAATTLGANTTFVGTIIDNANAITMGAGTILTGRALSLGAGTITTDTNTITRACSTATTTVISSSPNNTITVFKQVINDSGGTALWTDFPLFINGNPVASGQSINFSAGVYTVSETNRPGYTTSFTGNCNAAGQINHGGIGTQNSVCTVVNDDIGVPVVAPIPPLIDVVKVPNPLALPAGPGLVNYTYTVRNIGTVPMTNITMVGDTCSPIVFSSGDTNNNLMLDLTEVWVYRCSIVLSATHTNTIVATGWANGINAIDVASATVVVGAGIVPPLIHITKVPNPLTLPAGAGFVTYTKKVTNPGTVPLGSVKVTDDKCSPINYISGDTNNNSLLDVTETWTYTCRTRLTQTTTNTAIATGTANGLLATDFALATVVVAIPTLPATGFSPEENNNLWSTIIIVFSIIASFLLFYSIRKRRAV